MPVIASYARRGGRPPEDDERLEIDDDGSWRLLRTMGGARVGTFAGRLTPDRRRRLAAAIDEAVGAAPPTAPARPLRDAAHEAFRAGRASLGIPAGQRVDDGWAPLARLLRQWSGSLASARDAEGALELRLAPEGPVLARNGDAPLRLWPATVRIDLYARDGDGVIVDRAGVGPGDAGEGPRGEPMTTGPGWMLALAVPRLPAAPPGGRLEAWVSLDVDGPDGPASVRLVESRSA